MIAYLAGTFKQLDPTHVWIDVHGVGYEVKISLQTYSEIKGKEQGMLLTYLHIKEDAHTLYGFTHAEEKNLFLQLISISGVGPNTGLMILSSLKTQEIIEAILYGDHKTIQQVKGIGLKTAQRIVLELKDKVNKTAVADLPSGQPVAAESSNKTKEEALQALMTLGFAKAVAEKNILAVLKKSGPNISLEDLIKASLKIN
ncbi:Holliday junction DNA helicase subunit RuvA [Nitritalea halalkaliphila LW7]|uniref:Holliday junction branch migration complex subunit RuvA n=1 Tax=Nitritalea halalkaliphila LW7 TaxID=1189621 RepID=I5C9J8_9BACT|nr:Holliday junction branch migration protein RuvA [Nitritalea halalkaliphila]EIM78500.1 Holliday junction DNA helicase subunit RuvA [Nitritalea halalkaliphila LW7]